MFGTRPPEDKHEEKASTLYDIFEVGLRLIDGQDSLISRIEAAEIFTSIVFAGPQPSLLRGLSLYDLVCKNRQNQDGHERLVLTSK
jgi:hypothetical protein